MNRFLTTLLMFLAFAVGFAASANAEERWLPESERLSVDLAAGVYARYPMAMADTAGGVIGRYTFWAARNSWIGADTSVAGLVAVGESGTVYPGASVAAGFTLFVFDWLAMEIDVGLYGGAQFGDAGAVGIVGMLGQGAYRLQFGPHTLRLGMMMLPATALADDPGNDCVFCGGFMGAAGYDFRF